MKANRLKTLAKLGQSIWLDYIRRDLMSSGELHKLIIEDGLSGITSNPAIFAQAFASGDLYQEAIEKLLRQGMTLTPSMKRLHSKMCVLLRMSFVLCMSKPKAKRAT